MPYNSPLLKTVVIAQSIAYKTPKQRVISYGYYKTITL